MVLAYLLRGRHPVAAELDGGQNSEHDEQRQSA
jgi:hypothetical protein